MIIPFKTIPDLSAAFAAVPNDRQLAGLFPYVDTLDIVRLVGAEQPKRRLREELLIGAIRERLEAGNVVVPICNCGMGKGRRWIQADRGEEVTYGLDRSVERLPFNAVPYIHEGMQFVSNLGRRLELVPVTSGVPDILIEAAPFDGVGRTLGVTSFYERSDGDLAAGKRSASVRILIDTAELWTLDYFRTVFRHEAFHAVGLEHADAFIDLMYRFYTGVHLGHPGVWTQTQVDNRYTLRHAA